MTSANPINPNAIEPGDDLVSPERYDPLAQQDMSYDPDAAALGISQEEAETQRAIESEEGFEPTLGDPNADHAPKEVVDDRPAEVRTAELFERMRPSRHELLDILRLCVEPTDVERVYASVDEAKAHHRSVYSGESLCDLLVRAGALERDGADHDHIGAHVGDLGGDLLRGAVADLHHRDDGGDADHDAEHRQQRSRDVPF